MTHRGYIGQIRARLESRRDIDPVTNCWEYTRYKDRGYGQMWFDRRLRNVHVIAYLIYVGPIPKGKRVLHKCDNPPCFNPKHLFPGTQKDNVQDMIRKRRGLVGTKNGASILTPKMVMEIRERSKSVTGYRISLEMGLSLPCVYDVLRRRTWAWM